MERNLTFSTEARKKVLNGINKAADAIKVTFGAAGRNVLIEKMDGYPKSTKDGVTVARSIVLTDRIENMGAMLIKEVAGKTVDVAGDGTTLASLLTQSIITLGMKYVEKGANPIDLKKGIDKAVAAVVAELRRLSKKADTTEVLKQIATISANNDEEIGGIISQAIEKVGRDGIVEVEEAKGYDTTIEIVEGMQLDRGYLSPYFVNNQKQTKCELEEPHILLYDKKINTMKEFVPLLKEISATGKPLLIISEDLSDEVLQAMVLNKMQNGFKICAIKLPTFGGSKKLVMEDIAILTHGTFITEEKGKKLSNSTIGVLGSAQRVIVTKDKTTIIGGAGTKEEVQRRCEQIQSEIEQSEYDFDKEKMKQRLAKLSHGVAVIKIGGATEGEISEKRDRIDDALCATRAAVDEGFVAGGGATYLKCRCPYDKGLNEGETNGIGIINDCLLQPFQQILENAGMKPKDVLSKIMLGEYGLGINVKTGAFENLLQSGIIDPAKVLRVALENAASVASLFLTTECVISFNQNPS